MSDILINYLSIISVLKKKTEWSLRKENEAYVHWNSAAPVAQGKKEDILAELHPRAKRTRVDGAP